MNALDRPIPRAPRPDDPKIRFLIELSRALGTYGTAAHRLEEVITVTANEFGLECHVFSTPTSVFMSIEHDGTYETFLSRINPGEVNLSKLRRFDELFNAVIDGRVSPRAGVKRIKQVVHEDDRIPRWVDVAAVAAVSSSASIILGGGPRELGAACAIGLTLGLLVLGVGKNREYARLMEFLAGFIAALMSWMLMGAMGPYSPPIAMIAGLIIFIPGLTLTVSMTELATRNVVSGSARLIGALMIFLLMGFGAAIGTQTAHVLMNLPEAIESDPFPGWIKIPSAFVSSILFAIFFRARASDVWAMTLAVFVAFLSARFGVEHFGLEFGVCFAAACLGIAGNLFARALDRPSAIVMLPGLFMLVPGSFGFKSVQLLMDENIITGMQTAFTVLMIGAALVVGLLLANVLVPPRKVL